MEIYSVTNYFLLFNQDHDIQQPIFFKMSAKGRIEIKYMGMKQQPLLKG